MKNTKYESIEDLMEIFDQIQKEEPVSFSGSRAFYILCKEIKEIKILINDLLRREVGF